MNVSSRTPEGQPHRCPLCGQALRIEPADPPGDAPCPNCGQLIWFDRSTTVDIQLFKPEGRLWDSESFAAIQDAVHLRSDTHIILDLVEVRAITSQTLGRLLNLKKKSRLTHANLTLRNMDSDLREIFRITRLDQVFHIED